MSRSQRDRPGARQAAQREQAARQAAQRRRERRLLMVVVAAVVLALVGAGIGFQAWRTHRAPSAGTVTPGPSVPVTITDGQPISWGTGRAPVTVDLRERTIVAPGFEADFEIDDYTRWRLLEGLDDIGITLGHEPDIAAFETTRPSWKPATL